MKSQMKAAIISSPKMIELRDVKMPVPSSGEVLVNIKACALCTWEQRTFQGAIPMRYPFLGGHEFSGVIEQIGPSVNGDRFKIGKRVAVKGLYTCGECYYCRNGFDNLCENRSNQPADPNKDVWGPGGLGEYLVVKTKDIYFLEDSLPFEIGCLTEPLACVINSIEKGNINPTDNVLVIGGGIMGQLHVLLAKSKGARVILSEIHEERRILASTHGADETIDPSKGTFKEQIYALTSGRGADVVFNTTALAPVAQQAIDVVSKCGRVVMYSSIHPDEPIQISPNWLHNTQAEITGVVSPTNNSFYKASQMLSNGIIDVSKLITAKLPLDHTQEAFEMAVQPDTFRIIVTQD